MKKGIYYTPRFELKLIVCRPRVEGIDRMVQDFAAAAAFSASKRDRRGEVFHLSLHFLRVSFSESRLLFE